ncbi:MAG: NAD(P)H-dependent oxidoreductase [Planctomycetota bacterium]
MRITVLAGTNRKGSLSHRLAEVMADHYRALDCEVDYLDLREMGPEFLDPEAYKSPAASVSAMVDRFLASDGVVIIVPEYNGSYPGALKLFLDMLPDPEGFADRPVAFVGLAAGRFQGLRAVEHLQGVAGYRNAYIYPRRIFIGDSYKQFDFETGALKDAELGQRLKDQAKGFLAFVRRFES